LLAEWAEVVELAEKQHPQPLVGFDLGACAETITFRWDGAVNVEGGNQRSVWLWMVTIPSMHPTRIARAMILNFDELSDMRGGNAAESIQEVSRGEWES
jgi:hypothetical protein